MGGILIETENMDERDQALLVLALSLGDVRLSELGMRVHVVVRDHVTCPDGEVFDGFAWNDDIVLGTEPNGLSFAFLDSRTADSVEEALQDRDSRSGGRESTPSVATGCKKPLDRRPARRLTDREIVKILGGLLGGLVGNMASVEDVRNAVCWWAETDDAWAYLVASTMIAPKPGTQEQ